jgi:NTP pyrophosphatase (non-canonical NTP hydrolase)
MVERVIDADAMVRDDRHRGVCVLRNEYVRLHGHRLERSIRVVYAMSDTLRNAGESVERRGFLDGDQAEAFYDPILMAQIGRLMEEVGEFARSCRTEYGPSRSELADIAIVCSAIAHYLSIDLDMEVGMKCAADEEKRGYRHSWATPSKLAMKAPSENGEGAVYRDFS